MKITVKSVESSGEKMFVGFDCMAGSGIGEWSSSKAAPVEGSTYDVEIDIRFPIKLGENAFIEADRPSEIRVVGSQVQLIVKIEGVDEDGVVYLRLSRDCIFMMESEGSPLRPENILRLIVDKTNLLITPFDL